MAQIEGRNLTITDIKKQLTPKGGMARPVRMLEQSNEIEEYLTFQEANNGDVHQENIQVSLPEIFYIMVNQGSATSKSTYGNTVFPTATAEGRSYIHVEAVKNAKTRPMIRARQGDDFVEALGQRDKRTMFYGNPKANPEEYLGLSTYYGSLSETNGQNIISAGGTTNLGSMWLLGLGDDGIFMVFPEGTADSIGISRENRGIITIEDPNQPAGTKRYMEVYAEIYKLRRGLCVRNWQYGVRICNIDTAALIAGSGTQATSAATNLVRLMGRARQKPPKRGRKAVRWVWVCNQVMHTGLMLLAQEKQTNVLSIKDGFESHALSAYGIPILQCDQLLNTEQLVA